MPSSLLSSPPHSAAQQLTCYFESGDHIRSRSVADAVLVGQLDLSALPARLLADCERETMRLGLEPGDVEPLSIVRARARWPEHRSALHAMADWARSLGLHEALAASEAALMACRGAKYHHDGVQYGGAVFCNLFLSEDKGLDVHFPMTGLRIPLTRGTAMVFDTGQPHAVVPRHRSSFDATDFAPGQDCSQFFLSWELPVEDRHVRNALGIAFDTDPTTARHLATAQVRPSGGPACLCPESGRWL